MCMYLYYDIPAPTLGILIKAPMLLFFFLYLFALYGMIIWTMEKKTTCVLAYFKAQKLKRQWLLG